VFGLSAFDVTDTFAVVAINWVGGRSVIVQRAAGTVEVLGAWQTMQEDMDQSRVFNLRGEAELGLIVAHLAPAVALPIGVLPLPVTSIVLSHLLGFAVSSSGRHRPFDHGFVDHRDRDGEVGVLVVLIGDIGTTVLLHNFGVAGDTDKHGPCGWVGGAEGTSGLIRGRIEASRIDVITEGIVTDDTIDAELEAGEAGIEVSIGIPVTVVAFGLEVKRTANTGIGDHHIEELHASRFVDVEAEGIVFVLEFDEGIIQHVEREVGDLNEISGSDLDFNLAEVVASGVLNRMLRDEPRLIIEEAAIGAILSSESDPLVTSLTNVVRTKELFMDILGDAGVGLLKLENLFGWEQAIEKALYANPVGVHLFTQKLESIALGAGALDEGAVGSAAIRGAVGVVDLVEGGAGIVEPTAKAEGFLLGGVIERPRLLFKALEINAVSDELLHIEVVEILTTFTEKTVDFFARIEIYLIGHLISLFGFRFGFVEPAWQPQRTAKRVFGSLRPDSTPLRLSPSPETAFHASAVTR
jgi:hypothetical protein